MASTIKVFTAEQALEALNADPTKVLVLEKKKDDKMYKGTRFLNAYFNIGTDMKKEGWFNVEDIELSCGIADPNGPKNSKNEFESTRLQLETTVSRAGEFGQFLLGLDAQWRAQVAQQAATGVIDMEGKKVHGLVRSSLSKKNEKNPGGVIEDPVIGFKIDFNQFPALYRHKFLRGLPRTQFFDYSTRYIDEHGREQFKVAMVENDSGELEPVTAKNVHKFVTEGSILRKGRVMMPSEAESSSWVSFPIVINRAVIEQGGAGGFSDDAPVTPGATANVRAALAQTTDDTTNDTPVTPETTETPTTQAVTAADVDDVANMLNGL